MIITLTIYYLDLTAEGAFTTVHFFITNVTNGQMTRISSKLDKKTFVTFVYSCNS